MIDNDTNDCKRYNVILAGDADLTEMRDMAEDDALELWEKRDMKSRVHGYTLADIFEAECEDFADFAVQMSLRPDAYAKELIRYWAWKLDN